ncbi:MAG: MFS transporter [Candidatus Hermodarchaeota archaeon]
MDQSSSSFVDVIKSMNHNVKLTFLFVSFQSLGRGIWMGNVLSMFIYFLAGESNVILGLTSAATGIAMTLSVIPAGFLCDLIPRKWTLRTASVVGFIGLFFAVLAQDIFMIVISLLFWGLFQGLNRPSLESIFADSVESGNRSRIYAWNHSIRQIAMATGPFINAFLFLILGDQWEIGILKAVMIFGIVISAISLIIMVFFDDRKSLGITSENIDINNSISDEKYHSMSRSSKYIMIILLICNLIIGTGAGMTIKFFPTFYYTIYSIEPVALQVIMGLTSIATGLTSLVAQRFSLERGRAQIIFAVQGMATACLFIIAFYPPLQLLVPIFIARGSLMNASQPLSRSILMDVVPKRHRGKVNSIQTLSWGLFWNFSAALGGFLIGDNNNFQLCFLVTAGLYVIGTLPILLLIPLVAKEKYVERTVSELPSFLEKSDEISLSVESGLITPED